MTGRENDDQWLSEITLASALAMMQNNGVSEVLYKVLPKNANSKNQVYLGGQDPSQFSKLPTGEMTAHLSVSEKSGSHEAVFQAALDFYWLTDEGQLAPAPHAKMIFYPQYPEVRFSGFLKGCKHAPSTFWAKEKRGTEPGRILLLGLGNEKKVIGLTLPPEAPATKEILATGPHARYEVFGILPMAGEEEVEDGFVELMRHLCRIHDMGFVSSRRLDPSGALVPCTSSNCNGNTLEALLGIRSNGYSLPDFMGWEIKARQLKSVDNPSSTVVTLFTPEPTTGIYAEDGIEAFIRRFGYPDRRGRDDRLNFGGIHKGGQPAHHLTGLRLILDGYDPSAPKEYLSTGAILLMDATDTVAAGWSFAKLMSHWKEKHAQAAYVPCQQLLIPARQYRYGRKILLGEGAEFGLLLKAFYEGRVYYDPGIKLEGESTPKPKWKKRSQFRVASVDLPTLYEKSRIVDACDISKASW
ncbi:MvaI/BcnI restriction endonuclease family protein [Pseudoxanthomonas gei]|uniref:MvaI/BcnI restriction endonuclease family protein n=1 Tax=Pseudoxanthomonas gei TaxID=1383030 RepID=A0ABX0ABS8_9GAMM|nr:MvaI/BcnI family restriction endonuclease [Pseudoxanthomonas gei]NDK39034.1 MvaI/BcnI restriction endonuclease family protein [Pseudoxanthomonas gei]